MSSPHVAALQTKGINTPLSRRSFLVASGMGLAGTAWGTTAPAAAANVPQGRKLAKSTILFFLCGGSSHIDMWDLKPKAPIEYRGPFAPIATTAPGIELSEHLPLLAQQAHHLNIVRSVGATVNTNDHHAGYYHNLTGHAPDITFVTLGNNRTPVADDWPFMGSVVAAKKPARPQLPSAITLPHKPSRAPYTRPGQFAARIGPEFDPLYINGSHENPLQFHAPSLVLDGDVSPERLTNRRELLNTVDAARRDFETNASPKTWSNQQKRAVNLLLSSSTTEAFNVAAEPAALRERYGETINGMSLLLARRLVEAEVPFITVFWKGDTALNKKCKSAGSWDTHGNNFNCLKENLLPEFDRGFSALIEDLSDRGLLDETLLLVSSEMGRTPKIGDRRSGGVAGAGRDHWTHCLSNVFAGGGMSGGQVYGATDRFAQFPADRPVTPAHIAKTVYHAMGIDDLEFHDREGRPYDALPNGYPLTELF
ncbi:hypothetical protein Mal52_17760 [Symmachiella dynata]|uniref:DUF1501 domain-containing protein n=1 Tax=Symmachiella dynata TaxID=2527995 RepID=A0A517ZLD5_9PLAN|nr:DUF1501 domain-containing protein [Symmachiella dynata]QDU43304.1 hypothetical protein Mal52_17760 [Symmachiella dynata]